MKLNIGCGTLKLKGYVNVDIDPKFKPDVVWDITKKSKFKNNSVDVIFCKSVLEHLADFRPTMKEFHRILKKGGRLQIRVPHFTCIFWDIPSHIRPFSYYTFYHYLRKGEGGVYTDKNKEVEDIGKAYFDKIKVKFDFGKKIAVWNYLVEPLANAFPLIYESTFLRYLFPCNALCIELIK